MIVTSMKERAVLGFLLILSLLVFGGRMQCRAKEKAGGSTYLPRAQSAESRQGKALFEKQACATCHSISQEGGCLGPPLDGVGKYRSQDFLLARITDSAEAKAKFDRIYRLPELMPHPRLAPASASRIVAYLRTLPEPPHGFDVTAHAAVKGESLKTPSEHVADKEQSLREGRRLYHDLGCAACHSIGDIGGHIGPSLDGVGMRRSREFILGHMTGAKINSDSGKSLMPRVNASQAEINKIADFLMALPN